MPNIRLILWIVRDSNSRRPKPTDLQSVPVSRLGNDPFIFFAERGFEPTEPFSSTVFKTAAIDQLCHLSSYNFYTYSKNVYRKCHFSIHIAEKKRFELLKRFPVWQFSKLLVSATHPFLQCFGIRRFHP